MDILKNIFISLVLKYLNLILIILIIEIEEYYKSFFLHLYLIMNCLVIKNYWLLGSYNILKKIIYKVIFN